MALPISARHASSAAANSCTSDDTGPLWLLPLASSDSIVAYVLMVPMPGLAEGAAEAASRTSKAVEQSATAGSQRAQRDTMSRSTYTLAQRQELRTLLAEHPTLFSRDGPGDQYLITRKIANASSGKLQQSTTRTPKQKLQSEW